MKWYLIGVGILIIIGFFVYFSFFGGSASQLQTNLNTSSNFPISGSTKSTSSNTGGTTSNPPSSTNTTQNSTTIKIQGGGSAQVNNFLDNGVTEADVANSGNYYLAGSPGYCTPQGVCPHGASTTNFIVTFNANTQFFSVALTKEPIGGARLAAEAFLEQTLGLSSTDLCSLNYYVGTDPHTNAIYAAENLGFSSCPGATELPQ